MNLCSIPGCGREFRARGYCSMHWRRWSETGDPLKLRGKPLVSRRLRHLLDHMWDDCPKWPFGRSAKGGYGRLTYDGRMTFAHRVVCEMVHGPAPTPKHQAAHNCGKGYEGCFGAKCVQWKTPEENSADRIEHGTYVAGERHYRAKLNADQVQEIRLLIGRAQQKDLAARYGVTRGTISDIQRGRSWPDVLFTNPLYQFNREQE